MKKKILALCLVVALLATAIAGATLAFFTDETDAVVNTFTVGNVDIKLDETEWDQQEDHNLLPGVTFAKNPTITVEDGSDDCWIFMEVEMNKFNSWLRLVGIKNGFAGVAEGCECGGENKCNGHIDGVKLNAFLESGAYQDALDEWFADVDHDTWKIMNLEDVKADILASFTDASITTIKPIFAYKEIQSEGDDQTLFTSVTMPEDITSDELALSNFNTDAAEWKLTIKAYAIQAAELDTLDAAYAAMFPTT